MFHQNKSLFYVIFLQLWASHTFYPSGNSLLSFKILLLLQGILPLSTVSLIPWYLSPLRPHSALCAFESIFHECHDIIVPCIYSLFSFPGGGSWLLDQDLCPCSAQHRALETASSQNFSSKEEKLSDFLGSPVVKNPSINVGDKGLTPGPGRSHMLWGN